MLSQASGAPATAPPFREADLITPSLNLSPEVPHDLKISKFKGLLRLVDLSVAFGPSEPLGVSGPCHQLWGYNSGPASVTLFIRAADPSVQESWDINIFPPRTRSDCLLISPVVVVVVGRARRGEGGEGLHGEEVPEHDVGVVIIATFTEQQFWVRHFPVHDCQPSQPLVKEGRY